MKEKNNNLITLLDQAVKQGYKANFSHNDMSIVEVQDHIIPNNLIAELDYSDLQDLSLNLLLNHWNIDHIEVYDSLEHMEDYNGADYNVIMQDVNYMEVINTLVEPLSECISNHVNNVKNNSFLIHSNGFFTYYDKIAIILGEAYNRLNIYLIDDLYTIVEDI